MQTLQIIFSSLLVNSACLPTRPGLQHVKTETTPGFPFTRTDNVYPGRIKSTERRSDGEGKLKTDITPGFHFTRTDIPSPGLIQSTERRRDGEVKLKTDLNPGYQFTRTDIVSPGLMLSAERRRDGAVKILSGEEVLLMKEILGREDKKDGLLSRTDVLELEEKLKRGYILLKTPGSPGISEFSTQDPKNIQQYLSREDILKWEALFKRKDGTRVNIIRVYNTLPPAGLNQDGRRKENEKPVLHLSREDVERLENDLKKRNRRIETNEGSRPEFLIRADLDEINSSAHESEDQKYVMTRLREDHFVHRDHDQGNKERDNETILSILNPAEQETNNASTVNNSNEHAKLPQYNSNLKEFETGNFSSIQVSAGRMNCCSCSRSRESCPKPEERSKRDILTLYDLKFIGLCPEETPFPCMCYETTGHDITADAANHEPGLDVVFRQVDNRHLVLQEVKIQKPEHDFDLLRCIRHEEQEPKPETVSFPDIPEIILTTTYKPILQTDQASLSSISNKFKQTDQKINPISPEIAGNPEIVPESEKVEKGKDIEEEDDTKLTNKKTGVFSKLLGYKIKRIKETYSNFKKYLFL